MLEDAGGMAEVADGNLSDEFLGGGDFIDDVHGLKGIGSKVLGRSGFKFSLVVVLLFNFAYTVHNAFTKNTESEISIISFNNCSCDAQDRMIYRGIIFSFIGAWIVFQMACALKGIYKFMHDRIRSQMHPADKAKR